MSQGDFKSSQVISSKDEAKILARYFTQIDGPVFCLVNLSDSVKAALFSRYSRSAKSMRRIFLDEFYESDAEAHVDGGAVGSSRADRLFAKVISDYGDDSVAQLAGVHIAFEGVSNLATKVIERPRLMSYLEQSTRYLDFGRRADGSYPYMVPKELDSPIEAKYRSSMDLIFGMYEYVTSRVAEYLTSQVPGAPSREEVRAIKAAAFDAARGILPASTVSNVGVFGSPQGLESLIMHLRASELVEMRQLAELARVELEKVIPTFLTRLDQPDRGGVWVDYIAKKRSATGALVGQIKHPPRVPSSMPSVSLYSFDPEGEIRVAESIVFDASNLSSIDVRAIVAEMTSDEIDELFVTYVGNRSNRRHKPGRAFESTEYSFEVVSDYGSFRDLQRHRLLTVEWQMLGTDLGYVVPESVVAAGAEENYRSAMAISAELYQDLKQVAGEQVASYAVSMAHGIRYRFRMNAREAMHINELRSQPSGHPNYRTVVQMMHDQIQKVARHNRIATSMRYVDHETEVLGRLDEERRMASKRENSGRSRLE